MADFGFTPSIGGAPAAAPAPKADEFGFTPAGGQVAGASTPPPSGQDSGGLGALALNAGRGALNFINNNPISRGLFSLAALPAQGAAKLLGQPDPYASLAKGPMPVGVTSSDQPLGKFAEEEAGNAATVGSLFLPAGAAAEAAAPLLSPLLGRFAPAAARIAVGAGMGAFQGLAGGMQQGQSGSELKQSAGTGTLIGGGLSTAGELGSALLDSLAGNTAETRLGEQVNRLKTLQNSFDDNSTFMKNPATGKYTSTSNPIKTLSDTGLVRKLSVVDGRVNTDAVESGIQDMLASQDKQASSLVEGLVGEVPLADFRKAVEEAVKNNPQIRDAGKVTSALGEVQRRFDDLETSFGDAVTYPQVNNIRVAMNREFNPDMRDTARTIGDAARTILYDEKTGSPALKKLMGDQGLLLKAQNFVDRLRGTVVRGGRLGKYMADMVGSGVGTAMGAALGPFGMGAGAVGGAMAADRAMSMYQNNFFNPLMAGPAAALSRFASTPAVGAAARLGQAVAVPSAVQK